MPRGRRRQPTPLELAFREMKRELRKAERRFVRDSGQRQDENVVTWGARLTLGTLGLSLTRNAVTEIERAARRQARRRR